ncbi:MAG: NAD(+)/NADH kinase [Oscillospiraceae bacterium]|nr:NAD(+)/NADH kinase [Oscillospiraceae bacterium]
MKKVVLWPNPSRDIGFRVSLAAAALCAEEDVEAVIPAEVAGAFPETPLVKVCPLPESLRDADCLLALGGDGTILHLAKHAAKRDIPVLGVNLGRLGFMSELEADELPLITHALRGRAAADARMMLSLAVRRGGRTVHEDLALNDVVLTGGGQSRFLSILVRTDGQDMLSFMGDGVIVATPTGSTAYSMAAGGPIIEPHADSLAVTPICAHMTHVRPMVLSAACAVTLRASPDKEAVLLVDGLAEHPIGPGDEVLVSRSDKQTTLLRIKPYSFYAALSRKLQK